MEPIRRQALVQATIAEIGHVGSLDVTVSRIARRAGVSAALAHHYFGNKERLFLAAMRHILAVYGRSVREALRTAESPRARLDAIIRASFGPENFDDATISAWLNFYVAARLSPEASRLLAIYQRRLRSNLLHALRPLVGPRAAQLAEAIAALIDGLYIRAALAPKAPDATAEIALVRDVIDALIGEAP
ncbi:choline-binding transcriptional repressor BetI [Meinhardsimonia xiamenensis]|jgi:TetR/AcrR family transcriptional repressor of bet genes|nr:transcriptional regulator BetI [Meinhardsimonia xiamenensis]